MKWWRRAGPGCWHLVYPSAYLVRPRRGRCCCRLGSLAHSRSHLAPREPWREPCALSLSRRQSLTHPLAHSMGGSDGG